jgi:hypothetical protein
MYRSITLNEHLAGTKFDSAAAEEARSLFHHLTLSSVSWLRVLFREA